MNGLAQDLRYALRSLVQRPGLWLVATIALGLGIGANTAVFTVVDASLLRPLPWRDPGQLIIVAETAKGRLSGPVSGPNFLDWKTQSKTVAALAAYRARSVNLGGAHPERVLGASATSELFEVLGVAALVGQTLQGAERGSRTVVLNERLWRRRFNAAPAIVGETVTIDGEPFVVRGVVPSAAAMPTDAELWTAPRMTLPDHPIRPGEDTSQEASRGSHYMDVIGRLKPGVSLAAAQADLDVVAARIAEKSGDQKAEERGVRILDLREWLIGDSRPMLLLLSGAVAFILLIACANVGNLLLARALARQHEVSVRVALGASRPRLLRLFFVESLLVALPGGALGLLVALWGAPPLLALGPAQLRQQELHLDLQVLAFTAALSLLTAFAFGLIPAFSSRDPGEAMRQGQRSATGSAGQGRLRSALVALEVALCVVLLVGTGLMARSFLRLHAVNPGFDTAGVLTGDLMLPDTKYRDQRTQADFVRDLLARLAASGQVEAAGAVSRLPLTGGNSSRGVPLDVKDNPEITADFRLVSGDYLRALRIPLLAGRALTEQDRDGSHVMVNQTFARLAWPGQDPIGHRVDPRASGKLAEVVGVVGDVRHLGLEVAPRPEIYVAHGTEAWPLMSLVVRGRIPPAALVSTLNAALAETDRDLGLARVTSMEDRVDLSLAARRFAVLLLAVLSGVALVLAVTGLYGVMAYMVAQRTREMGIRLALGASPADVLRLVVGQAMSLVVVGLAAGLAGALAMTGVLKTFLYGISATDPGTFAGITTMVALTGALAGLVAARRATSVDPAVALRAE